MKTGKSDARISHRIILKTLAALGVAGVLLGLAACGQAASGRASSPTKDFANTVAKFHLALDEFVKGNPQPALSMGSKRDDVTLGNPFGPIVRGRNQVVAAEERAASVNGRPTGQLAGVDIVATYESGDLAAIVEVERYTGGPPGIPPALRSTIIFRRENGAWKIVHRLADFLPSG